jgi:ketosteroid isomerase-like protein
MTQLPDPLAETGPAVVRRVLAALAAGDCAAVRDGCSAELALEVVGDPPHLPYSGRYRGHPGLREYHRRRCAAAEIMAFEAVEIVPVGADRVLVLGREHLRFRETGMESRGRWLYLFTVTEGLVSSATFWSDTAAQLVAHRGF